jgi:hypothetical protein
VRADSLAALQKSVDALLKAATTGNAGQVPRAATDLVTCLVNVVAATLIGGGLPAPDLAGLPAEPAGVAGVHQPAVPHRAVQRAAARVPAAASQNLPTGNLPTGNLAGSNLTSNLLSGLLPGF